MAIKNIPLRIFREYLLYKGLRLVKTEGGHEKWWKEGMLRPVILQTHVDPVPEFVIRNNLTSIGSKRKELEEWLNPAKNRNK
jgi:hypothetical protein